MKILHVVHALGSGVETAMSDYVAVTPQHEHHLFFSADPTCEIARNAPFAGETEAPGGLPGYARELRATVRRLQPDVVHAHSSVAGGVVRLVVPRRRRRIVYTPHCFGFERRDLPGPARAAFWLIEALLAARTSALVACSPREAALARWFPVRVRYVPNVAHVDAPTVPAGGHAALRVVACGRVAAQKDPSLLAEIARAADVGFAFEWVGGGDADLVRELTDAGVTVTGWVSREQAVDRLARADVYVHTARWESAPMSVLEAAALDVPVLARDTPSMRALGCTPLWSTPQQLRELLADPASLERARRCSADITARHSVRAQTDALTRVYDAGRAVGLRDAG